MLLPQTQALGIDDSTSFSDPWAALNGTLMECFGDPGCQGGNRASWHCKSLGKVKETYFLASSVHILLKHFLEEIQGSIQPFVSRDSPL